MSVIAREAVWSCYKYNTADSKFWEETCIAYVTFSASIYGALALKSGEKCLCCLHHVCQCVESLKLVIVSSCAEQQLHIQIVFISAKLLFFVVLPDMEKNNVFFFKFPRLRPLVLLIKSNFKVRINMVHW
jgi:hypothetical protein